MLISRAQISGAEALLRKNEGVYDELQKVNRIDSDDEAKIVKDVARTFELKGEAEQQLGFDDEAILFAVLKAYSVFDPSLGYCQGMNFIAANLLTHLEPEKSFWLFAANPQVNAFSQRFSALLRPTRR